MAAPATGRAPAAVGAAAAIGAAVGNWAGGRNWKAAATGDNGRAYRHYGGTTGTACNGYCGNSGIYLGLGLGALGYGGYG